VKVHLVVDANFRGLTKPPWFVDL